MKGGLFIVDTRDPQLESFECCRIIAISQSAILTLPGNRPMPFDDPSTWAQGATALKTAFDSFRSAISLVKDVRSLGGGSEQQQKAIDGALATATTNTAIAEAELAKAFGYELCKCEFPPTPMKTIGYFGMAAGSAGKRPGDPVYECPKCGYRNSGPLMFTKTKGAKGTPSAEHG
jgi:hypothetical protein